MDQSFTVRAADTPQHLAQLRAFVAAEQSLHAQTVLDGHLQHPRYHGALTRIAERDGRIVGYALISRQRRRMGATTLDVGAIDAITTSPGPDTHTLFIALLGDVLQTLAEHVLPLAIMRGPISHFGSFGFAAYSFQVVISVVADQQAPQAKKGQLRLCTINDLDDLAALHAASYGRLPLTPARTMPEWRGWLIERPDMLLLEDPYGRTVAYALLERGQSGPYISEAAAADAGAARALLTQLHERSNAEELRLPLRHIVAQAALHMGGSARIAASAANIPNQEDAIPLAGVVDLPAMLDALTPEFERRLAQSRYAGWSGNLRIEIETERITLAIVKGHATMIDGSRPADVRLRRVTLAALVQLCLGYRAPADLRATGELDCPDAALGLLDSLFPTLSP